jgi:hypothetical protein
MFLTDISEVTMRKPDVKGNLTTPLTMPLMTLVAIDSWEWITQSWFTCLNKLMLNDKAQF